MARHPKTASGTVGIPFGERGGRLYAPTDVERGRACNCRCPACGSALQAKHGKKRRPHFAHDTVLGQRCLESVLHLYAKQLLAEATQLKLPAWSGTPGMPNPPSASDGEGRLVRGRPVIQPERTAAVDGGRQEVPFEGIRADVVVNDNFGPLVVEVRATHRVDDAKEAKVRGLGLRMMEIDVSTAPTFDSTEFARWVLFEAPRRWIWNPEAAAAWQQSREGLEAAIAARVPVFGPGGRRMLVRVPGLQADAVRVQCAAVAQRGFPRANLLLGAWLWLEGVGAAEISATLDASGGCYLATAGDGRDRIVCLGRPALQVRTAVRRGTAS